MSHKRIKLQLKNMDSSAVEIIDGDVSTFFTFTSTTFSVHHGGTFRIINRLAKPFEAKMIYAKWEPLLNVTPSANGALVIYVDLNGIDSNNVVPIKSAVIGQRPKMPAYDPILTDMNDAVQIAIVSVTSGFITSGGPQIQWGGNRYNRDS